MKVSIVVPNYNHGKYLTACLDSIKMQLYKNYEVFIYDNCSKDNSIEVAQDYVKKNPKFKLITSKTHSHSAAKNIDDAIRNYATGEVCTWLNADDRFKELYLTKILPYFTSPDVGFVRIGITANFEDTGEIVVFGPSVWNNIPDIVLQNKVYPSSPFRRELFLECGGMDEKARFWDWDFWVRCGLSCASDQWTYATCNLPLIVRRIHGPECWEDEIAHVQNGQPFGNDSKQCGADYIMGKYIKGNKLVCDYSRRL